jgi:hypothetical protein
MGMSEGRWLHLRGQHSFVDSTGIRNLTGHRFGIRKNPANQTTDVYSQEECDHPFSTGTTRHAQSSSSAGWSAATSTEGKECLRSMLVGQERDGVDNSGSVPLRMSMELR